MTGQQITIAVIVAVVALAIAYDIWVALKYGTASTISWVTWTTARKYPVIPFAVGILCGHLFWVQQTGMESAEHGHAHAPTSEQSRRDAMVHEAVAHGARSGHWPVIRKQYLAEFPACEACGFKGDGLQVHHVEPFHMHPELELDLSNLITLCGPEGHNCHLRIGHSFDFKAANPNVRDDAARQLKRIKERVYDESSIAEAHYANAA